MKMTGYSLALAACLVPGLAVAATIGPDSFGYTLTQTSNPGAYTTVVGGVGTVALTNPAVASSDDDVFSVSLPFTFTAYGVGYNQVQVTTNGFLLLGNLQSGSFGNEALTGALSDPNQQNSAGLYPYWDDLFLFGSPNTGALFTQTRSSGGHQQQVFQWDQIGVFGGDTAETITFQAILQDDGTIFFVYPDVSGLAGHANGLDASVGFRDVVGDTNGRNLQLSFNTASLSDGDLITIVDPPPVTGVPEPISISLVGGGLTGLVLLGRRKRKIS